MRATNPAGARTVRCGAKCAMTNWTRGKRPVKCCNPSCDALFDHREGRLIRFSGALTNARTLESRTFIHHYWLCGKCAEIYVFDRKSTSGLKIKVREQRLRREEPSEAVFAA